mmetsp:Transcript_42060/g.98548  ORF Transcript_42060/g.98548 Transcript_42060/m.98548 type:complete len:212 (-) Transcript_42060:481-1116(-)
MSGDKNKALRCRRPGTSAPFFRKHDVQQGIFTSAPRCFRRSLRLPRLPHRLPHHDRDEDAHHSSQKPVPDQLHAHGVRTAGNRSAAAGRVVAAPSVLAVVGEKVHRKGPVPEETAGGGLRARSAVGRGDVVQGTRLRQFSKHGVHGADVFFAKSERTVFFVLLRQIPEVDVRAAPGAEFRMKRPSLLADGQTAQGQIVFAAPRDDARVLQF